jgi:hypothetical protein
VTPLTSPRFIIRLVRRVNSDSSTTRSFLDVLSSRLQSYKLAKRALDTVEKGWPWLPYLPDAILVFISQACLVIVKLWCASVPAGVRRVVTITDPYTLTDAVDRSMRTASVPTCGGKPSAP